MILLAGTEGILSVNGGIEIVNLDSAEGFAYRAGMN